MSAPWSIGRIRYGVASVLSTISGTPALRATSAIRLDVGDAAGGVGDRFDEDRLGARRHRALETADIVGIGPRHVPAKALERMRELVDRAAIEFSRGDELVARHQQLLQHHDLRRVSRGNRQRRGAAFQRRNALFQHGGGRVADAGIDVAERLQPEQRGGMVGIVEHEGRGLIDRRHPRAGGGIGLRAGMHGKGRKSRETVGHSLRPVRWLARNARHADRSRVRRQGEGVTCGELKTGLLS